MTPLLTAATLLLTLLMAAGLAYGLVGLRRGKAHKRLEKGDRPAYPTRRDVTEDEDEDIPEHRYFLRRWLAKAGYRNHLAPAIFVLWTVAAIAIGIVFAAVTAGLGIFRVLAFALVEIPGDFAELFAPVLRVGPYLILGIVSVIPLLHVRARRRRIVESAERELPLVLELLATLAQSGLGFDAAISRLSDEDHGVPTVAAEFTLFQRETLSGVPRVRCLRRMAERLDVPTFSTFISSLVQAERSGFGLGEVLRHQAEDLRNRRRESALMRAQALPVKLVFPLVLCFLPALFVLTLGPAFFTFFQLTDSVTRTIK